MIDIFAGAGGLSTGLAAVGFEAVAAIEIDENSASSYAANHPGVVVSAADIATISLTAYTGVEMLAGGPPCQPFSIGGKRLAEDDERNGFPQFLRAVREIKPKAFVLENVAGAVSGVRRTYYEGLLAELSNSYKGYAIAWKVLNAADYGVPQKRQRVVAVGILGSTPYRFPDATHGEAMARPWLTAGSVLSSDLSEGAPNSAIVTYAKRPDLRPDPFDGHVYNGGGRPIDLERPAPTLLASMGGNKTPWLDTLGVVRDYHSHLRQGGTPRSGIVPGARRITVAEATRLQTFPVGTIFCGARSSQYRQVGNAVPPLLASVIGRSLIEQVF